jgi:hypothetical protein
MNDQEIDRLVAQTQPPQVALVGSLDLGRGGRELLEQIMSMPTTGRTAPVDLESQPEPDLPVLALESGRPERPYARVRTSVTRRRRALIAVAAAAALAAAVAGPTIAFHGRNEVVVLPGAQPPVTLGSGNPHLLIDDPAWKITYVDESAADYGETHIAQGRLQLSLNWYPAAQYEGFYKDRLGVSKPQTLNVLGHRGALFTYSPDDLAVMLPAQGKSFLEIRGGVGDQAAFEALLGRLKVVSAKDWVAALPASVVTPAEESEVAEQMLADVPQPAGFDVSTLSSYGSNDYYQYGAAVVGQVTCAWLDQYERARAAGDEPGMAAVDQALSGSHQWAVLQRMSKEGDYPQVLWDYADQVAERQDPVGYQQGLGCG